MSDSSKNRVASSKTTRGSHDPSTCTGDTAIVQPLQLQMQHAATPEELNRVLEVGKLLRAVLTPGEMEELRMFLRSIKARQC
jgi:hypothetical protein